MNINRKTIIQLFISHFNDELTFITTSAKAAHEAATHEESKAEDRHDTFAIEASYLAAGQAARYKELVKIIAEFENFLSRFEIHDAAKAVPTPSLGSIVELEHDGKTSHTFLANSGGGAQVKADGILITVVTPHSPLGESLFGAPVGEELSIETKAGLKEYTVKKVL